MRPEGTNTYFFDDEKFELPAASGEYIKRIIDEILIIEKIVPEKDHNSTNKTVGNVGIGYEEGFYSLALNNADTDYRIILEVHKEYSEERVLNDLIAVLEFSVPAESRFVTFCVYAEKIVKESGDSEDFAPIQSGEEPMDAIRRWVLAYREEEKKAQEAQFYIKLTGMNFVSSYMADQLFNIVRKYKEELYKVLM